MSPESTLPNRRSIRLKDYDYTRPGAYFITLYVRRGLCVLGEVDVGRVRLSVSGEAVEAAWERLPTQFQGVRIGPHVVMPNHVHGIITLTGFGAQDQGLDASDGECPGSDSGPPPAVGNPLAGRVLDHSRSRPLLGEVVRVLKSTATQAIRRDGLQDFAWLRNYYEHIIRNDDSYQRIARYMRDNPSAWHVDLHNPGITDDRLEFVCRSLAKRYGFPADEAGRMLAYTKECRRNQ